MCAFLILRRRSMIVVVLTLIFSALPSHGDDQKQQPIDSFLVGAINENGARVLDFAARGGNLYFLVSAAKDSDAAPYVLRTSSDGATIREIRGLPRGASNIDVYNDQIIVRDVGDFIAFDLEGRPNPRIGGMNRVPIDFCATENGVLGVDGLGDVFLSSSSRETRIGNVGPGAWRRLTRAGVGKFAVILGPEGGRLSIGSVAGGAVETYTPDTPLLAGLREQFPQMGNLQLILFVDVASDAAGDIFITVSGTQLAKGTPVLQFDGDGSHKATRRYQLPEFAELDEVNGHRFMSPQMIGIGFQSGGGRSGSTPSRSRIGATAPSDNEKLIFVDRRGAVAVFDLKG